GRCRPPVAEEPEYPVSCHRRNHSAGCYFSDPVVVDIDNVQISRSVEGQAGRRGELSEDGRTAIAGEPGRADADISLCASARKRRDRSVSNHFADLVCRLLLEKKKRNTRWLPDGHGRRA